MASGYTNYSGVFLAQSAPYTVTVWGSGTETLIAKSAPTRLIGSNLGNSLQGGAYDDTLYAININDRMSGGGGVDTEYATVNVAVLPNDIENLTMDATWGPVIGIANNNANILTAATAKVTLDGKGGDDVLVGFGSQDTFIFEPGSGKDIVYNFKTGSAADADVARLVGYGFNSLSDVTSAMTQVGADVQLKLSSNDLVLFKNTTIASFTSANFKLGIDPSKLKATFDEEFNSLSLQDIGGGNGTWTTYFPWDKYNAQPAHNIAGEQEVYVDPQFAGTGSTPLGLNPFSINNGVLTITAAPTPAALKPSLWNLDYTSGALTTFGSFSQTYGYFEMRADLPDAKGVFPAFWLLPADGTHNVELDIMEYIGETNTVYDTAHWGSDATSQTATTIRTFVPDLSSGYHTFGLLWTPSYLTWYVDGTEMYKIPTPIEANKPMYMLLNYAVGGAWPGAASGGALPPFNIDYVRAYSLDAAAPITGTSGADTLTGTPLDDTLNGGGGIDYLSGGAGNDTYLIGSDADKVIEKPGEGTDTVVTAASYVLPANVENLTLNGSGRAGGFGNTLNNVIIGNGAANQLQGYAGADTINGGGGDDTIIGGPGDDSLTGGAGADNFTFAKGDGHDTITDFGNGADVLNLSSFTSLGMTPTVTASGSDTLIQFSNGESVLLLGVQPGQLLNNGGNFIHV
jgi:beta-glucanase (GH16 family)